MKATVVGAGLAGVEASWQLAEAGIEVDLYEMRPHKMTPAHTTSDFGELVCSNSFKSQSQKKVIGILKEEIRLCGSRVMWASDQCAVPAGQALAVDRDQFGKLLTKELENHPKINIIREEITEIPSPSNPTILCTGPLTSDSLASYLQNLLGEDYLYFYDAIAPIVDAETINTEVVFSGSRYNKGTDDYLNCPLNKEEFTRFLHALNEAQKVKPRPFEKEIYFDRCMPIEVIASKGEQTLTYGPFKPVGFTDPRTGEMPYAILQLRQENRSKTAYNLVGCQTKLKHKEQQRVFRLIPGLENATFLKYGDMHRNTYINSPKYLTKELYLKKDPHIYFAGQITGVEGYIESASIGLLAGRNLARTLIGKEPLLPSNKTVLGSLIRSISDSQREKDYRPISATWGIIEGVKKRQREHFFHTAVTEVRSYNSQYLES